jgi:hypothetical protein
MRTSSMRVVSWVVGAGLRWGMAVMILNKNGLWRLF